MTIIVEFLERNIFFTKSFYGIPERTIDQIKVFRYCILKEAEVECTFAVFFPFGNKVDSYALRRTMTYDFQTPLFGTVENLP